MTPEPIAPAAKRGRVEALTALRDRLAADIDSCRSSRDLASLAQRLLDVIDKLSEVEAGRQSGRKTGLSEFEERLRDPKRGLTPTRRRSRINPSDGPTSRSKLSD